MLFRTLFCNVIHLGVSKNHPLIATASISQCVAIRNLAANVDTKAKRKKLHTEEYMVKVLASKLDTTPEESYSIFRSGNFNQESFKNALRVLEVYLKFRIDKNIIRNNPSLLELSPGSTEKKLEMLSKTNLKCMDHAVPFLSISSKKLVGICYKTMQEAPKIPHGNRLYYLSEQLKADPIELGKFISKRLFIYHIKFDQLQETLSMLLEMGVDPENIIKDLWVLRYKSELIDDRLNKIQRIGRKKLMPWMVKCPQRVLERTISLTTITKDLLGENKSVMNYLAERLKCSNETVDAMATKIPAILTVRVRKVKSTLDFLFSEGYSERDIIVVPRVLAHSVKTMQKRLNELKSMGFRPKNLNILCKSKREFEKYLAMMSKTELVINPETYEKQKYSTIK